MASPNIHPQSVTFAESTTQLADLPEELIRGVLRFLDVDTISQSASLISRAWRDAARDIDVWRGRLSPRLLGQLERLEALGPLLWPAHLHLALTGRNLLRNPGFRREDNSVILQPLPPLGTGRWPGWSRWQRTAWVVNTSVGKEVDWEQAPKGMTAPGGAPPDPASAAAATAPEPPLPYPGSGHLVSRMRRAFQGFMDFVQRGPPFVDGVSAAAVLPAASAQQQHHHQQVEPWAVEEAEAVRQRQGGVGSCLATLGSWSEVVQVIELDWELQRRGLSAAQAAHLLDSELGLRLSVYVGARLDSEGEYAVALLLDEGAGTAAADAIPSLQSFVARPSRHLGYQECEHLAPGTWQRFEYVLTSCPRGARRAVVMLRGRRAPGSGSSGPAGVGEPQQPATRFCGVKFASAQLVFE